MDATDPQRVLWLSRLVAILAMIAAIVPSAMVYWGIEAVPSVVIPVLVAAVPLAGRTQRGFHALSFAAAMLMLLWVFLGGFSIGFLYVPCLVLLLNASLIARNPQPWIRSLKLSRYGFLGGVILSLAYAALELLSPNVALGRPRDFLGNWQIALLSGFAGAGVVFLTTFGTGRKQP